MWPRPSPSYAVLSVLALSALAALIKYGLEKQETFTLPSSQRQRQRRLSLNSFADPKSSYLRSLSGTTKTYMDLAGDDVPLPQYSIQGVIEAANLVQSRYALLRYDPSSDKFIGYYSKNHLYVSGCGKLTYAITQLTMILRALFPERFTPDSPELVLAVQAGDYPDAMPYRPCVTKNLNAPCDKSLLSAAPVLTFGSVFSNPLFPNMMGFPMPGEHLTCFLRWATRKEVCPFFQYDPAWSTLSWDQLKPQLVWRGTDFRFLSIQGALERPTFEKYVNGQTDPNADQTEATTALLKQNFSKLLPRWKGVVLTAESEIEARRTNTMPKVNIKFPRGAVKDMGWEQNGFPAVGERMDKAEIAAFKYHIDLGGGGGTTWTGTTDKLKMPGLLFHHETAAKDYIHDDIQPWVHYVPVKSDLSDVMEKLEWAESHQVEAKEIAENASQLMEKLGQPEGFDALFVRRMLNPLVKVIEAYQPMNLRDDAAWNDAFEKLGGNQFTPLIECSKEGCHNLEGAKNYDERDPKHTPFDQLVWRDTSL